MSNDKIQQEYGADSIDVLKGLEAVRLRPGMYVGGTDERAFHHLVWEIVDNSVDEHVAGYCKNIKVTFHKDGSCEIDDDGRGIPTGIHPVEGVSSATLAVTKLHAGGKFGKGGAYKTSGGLHGVGATVTNALSTRFEMTICQGGHKHQQIFTDGGEVDDGPLRIVDKSDRTGTNIRFWPNRDIFKDEYQDDETGEHIINRHDFNFETVKGRLKMSSYLNPGLKFTITDARGDEPVVVEYMSNDFTDLIRDQSAGETPVIDEPFAIEKTTSSTKGDVYVRIACQPFASDRGEMYSFANNIRTPAGGTHEQGFRTALLRAINKYGDENKLIKENLVAEDVREGLFAAILVRIHHPEFEGQTKDKLTNREVSGSVQKVFFEEINKFFEENPNIAKAWVERARRAQAAREAAKRARELTAGNKGSGSIGLPEKLATCSSRTPEECELFLVEGDSAGGSAKQGRDRRTQAILPLKGKIMNTYRQESSVVLKSQEVANIIATLGTGFGEHFNIEKLRYHKIILMTDADVDGAHIATLLSTFFHKYTPELIKRGHIYLAVPPLYCLSKGTKKHYIKDNAALEEFFKTENREAWTVNRFKGLGEMNHEQLKETTMNKETRTLYQLSYEISAEEDDAVFNVLMSEDVPPRREFIEKNAKYADITV